MIRPRPLPLQLVLPALALALTATITPAQTLVFPGVVPPSPWTPAGSPYVIAASLTLPNSLTIQAGVEVRIRAGLSITAGGPLVVQGTAIDPVLFRADTPGMAWKGLTVQRSGSTLDHCQIQESDDGGVRIESDGVTMRDCIVRNNTRAGDGAGLRITPAAGLNGTVLIERCWVLDNDADQDGGGVYVDVPGGVTVEMRDCVVARNRANPNQQNGSYFGGGLYATGAGSLLVERSVIRDNRVSARCSSSGGCRTTAGGGAVYVDAASATLSRTVCANNRVDSTTVGVNARGHAFGGGIYVAPAALNTRIDQCVVSCNWLQVTVISGGSSSTLRGAGVFAAAGSATTLDHTTIANNGAMTGGGGLDADAGATVAMQNGIVWGNIGGSINGAPTIDHSCIEGGYTGTGNIASPPGFNNAAGCLCDDLAIVAGSPCVDAGSGAAEPASCALRGGSIAGTGFGSPTPDMGHLGGALGCGWRNAPSPFTLAIVPVTTTVPATVTMHVSGARPGAPAAVILTGVNGMPFAPTWLNLFGLVCAPGTWTRDLPIPVVPTPSSFEFVAVSLPGTGVAISASVSLGLE